MPHPCSEDPYWITSKCQLGEPSLFEDRPSSVSLANCVFLILSCSFWTHSFQLRPHVFFDLVLERVGMTLFCVHSRIPSNILLNNFHEQWAPRSAVIQTTEESCKRGTKLPCPSHERTVTQVYIPPAFSKCHIDQLTFTRRKFGDA